ncbi:MAG: hypothetical protein HDR37_03815 [Treponema sp.]|nr:hypothetical protein [Treponema sp.]
MGFSLEAEIQSSENVAEVQNSGVNVGAVIGVMVIMFSLVVTAFKFEAGMVGVSIGCWVLIIAGIRGIRRKNRLLKNAEVSAENSDEYNETVKRHIIQDENLSDKIVNDLLDEYCERESLFGDDAEKVKVAILGERGNFQKSLAQQQVKSPSNSVQDQNDDLEQIVEKFTYKANAVPTSSVTRNHYTLFYTDFNGNPTRREIDLKEFLDDGKLYIRAWCYLRQDIRQFDICRINRLFDCSGQEIPCPEQYFRQMYKNSDECKIADYFKSHIFELKILVFLARADGQMRKNEREVIADYIRRTIPEVSNQILDSRIKACSCEFSEFTKLLKLFSGESAEKRTAIVDSAEKIYSLKKNPDAMETGIFQKIQELKKHQK